MFHSKVDTCGVRLRWGECIQSDSHSVRLSAEPPKNCLKRDKCNLLAVYGDMQGADIQSIFCPPSI